MTSHMEVMQLCRLCLEKEQVNVQIFEDSDIERQVHHKISTCLPVKVEKEDILPKKICDGCMYKLDILYEFWTTCANAETQLNEWLQESEFAVTEEEAEIDTKHEALCHGEEETLEEVAEIAQDALEEEVVSEPPPKRIKKIAENNEIGIELMTVAKTEVESDEEQAEETVYEEQPIDVPGPSGISQTDTKLFIKEEDILNNEIKLEPDDYEIIEESWNAVKTEDREPELVTLKNNEEIHVNKDDSKSADPLYCKTCNKRFGNNLEFALHTKDHSPKNTYQCHLCGYTTFSFKFISVHMDVHRRYSKLLSVCNICNEKITTEKELEEHKQTHSTTYFCCSKCDKLFLSKAEWTHHARLMHMHR